MSDCGLRYDAMISIAWRCGGSHRCYGRAGPISHPVARLRTRMSAAIALYF